MTLSRVFAAAAFAASIGLGNAQAQSQNNGLVPAEFPPASYQGRQYVDSQGCVFIRAGIDGNVTWVPRVTRSRKVICGFKPTFARKAAVPEPETVTAPKPVPVAKPVPKRAAKPKAQPVRTAPQPNIPGNRGRQAACRGGNAVSQPYVGRVGDNVRCGPQQGTFATNLHRRSDDRGAAVTARQQAPAEPVRVVPRHVYEDQVTCVPGISIPEGYKPAWDDDRLNTRRAHQTMAGKAQMDQIWTETVPRKLIPYDAGRVATSRKSGEYVPVRAGGSTMTLSTRSASAKTTRRANDR